MKYIRTRYGISELCDEQHIEGFVAVKCPLKIKGYRVVSKENIINQADTIKELCDEFVISGNRPIIISQTTVMSGRMLNKTPVIYGAIWTNKGLIYVAKMNEKGELELLWIKVN